MLIMAVADAVLEVPADPALRLETYCGLGNDGGHRGHWLNQPAYYYATMSYWRKVLEYDTDSKTLAAEAFPDRHVLFVPFDMEYSWVLKSCTVTDRKTGKTTTTTHRDRVASVVAALQARPEPKLWPIMSWRAVFFSGAYITMDQLKSLGLVLRVAYLGFPLKFRPWLPDAFHTYRPPQPAYVLPPKDTTWFGNNWARRIYMGFAAFSCTVSSPIVSLNALRDGRHHLETTFGEWQNRSWFFYFRGRGQTGDGRASFVRTSVVRWFAEGSANDTLLQDAHADSVESYADEMYNAKFCIVTRSDDPQTSRLVDAIEAGCIPLVINEAFFNLVAPFHTFINYASFTVQVAESLFITDPMSAVALVRNMSPHSIGVLWANLMRHRRDLLFTHPKSRVVRNLLRLADEQCLSGAEIAIANEDF